MPLAWSGFVCDSKSIIGFLQKLESSRVYWCSKYDDPQRVYSSFRASGMRHMDGYEVVVIKERFGYRGSVQVRGPDETMCEKLLRDFFIESEAVKLSDECPQLWKPAVS